MSSWRLARSLQRLQSELDAAFPNRVKPDWTIGDAAHRNRPSDHNPNPAGVVCAIDVRGVATADKLWSFLLATKDERIKYLIYKGRIVSATNQPWVVRSYSGPNPHNDHIHISVGRGRDGQSVRPDLYDSNSSWGVAEEFGDKVEPEERPQAPSSNWPERIVSGMRTLDLRKVTKAQRTWISNDHVKTLQALLVARGFAPRNTIRPNGTLDGIAGPGTKDALDRFQRSTNTGDGRGNADSIAGENTWGALTLTSR